MMDSKTDYIVKTGIRRRSYEAALERQKQIRARRLSEVQPIKSVNQDKPTLTLKR